jgi:uncharacterized protein (UPF0262 family)
MGRVMRLSDSRGKVAGANVFDRALWIAGTSLAASMLRCNMIAVAETDRIASIALDDATILTRGEDVERERETALRDLAEDSAFVPCRAAGAGHAGPWSLRLSLPDARLCIDLTDGEGREAGSIGLGLARFRRVVREYFVICDSYYKALRQASARELETLDMARRAIHDRGTRQLLEALDGKVETDFATARRLFTLICVLHIRG